MYTSRKYSIGDRVFVLVKGGSGRNENVHDLLNLGRDAFSPAKMRTEPLFLMEGYVSSIRQALDPNTGRVNEHDSQARHINVIVYPYEETMSDDCKYLEYPLADNFVDSYLSTLSRAVGSQITTEDQWKFAVRFTYPEVVVEQGYSRLLGDLVSAFNPQPPEVRPSDRQAVIDEATRLGFKVRTMPVSGYRARWTIPSVQPVNEAVGRYNWQTVSGLVAAAGG